MNAGPRRRAAFLGALLGLGLGLGLSGKPARGEPLVADLTSHLIAISTGFTGASVVLFGAVDDAGGDVIVVVRGPERPMVVRRKSRVAGIWVNVNETTFTGVPSFYAMASSRPIAEIAPPAVQALHQIGLDNVRLGGDGKTDAATAAPFRAALVALGQRQGLYSQTTGKVNFLGQRLFRTTIAFPANVPTGTYLVEVFLIRNKSVVSGQTTPLVISEVGLNADVNEFADRHAAIYGTIAVVAAVMAGWLASLPFRNA